MDKSPYVFLFKRDQDADGNDGYWRVGHDFKLSELGGTIPQPGDVIVPPLNLLDASKYTLYVVEGRFFRPPSSEHHWLCVSLIVSERRAKPEEAHLVVGGG